MLLLPMYAGADGTQLRAAVSAGAKGTVVQALSLGDVNVALYEAIKEAIGRGVVVVISTRVPRGRVLPVYGNKGRGQTLKEARGFRGYSLTAKASILLLLALQTTTNPIKSRNYLIGRVLGQKCSWTKEFSASTGYLTEFMVIENVCVQRLDSSLSAGRPDRHENGIIADVFHRPVVLHTDLSVLFGVRYLF